MSETIGERIAKRRNFFGITQEEIASKLGINRVSYSHYEKNKNIPPSDKLSIIADEFKTTADYLLGKTDNPSITYLDTNLLQAMTIREAAAIYGADEGHDIARMLKKQIQNILDDDSLPLSDRELLAKTLHSKIEDLTTNNNKSFKGIPLVGTICAGDGLLAEQNIEDYVAYPFSDTRKPDYALRVDGTSMIDAGIEHEDIVYFKKSEWAEYSGQIVAAIINDSDRGTLKRIKWSEGSNKVQLIPENDEFDTIEVYPNQIQICGVYLGHFKPEKSLKWLQSEV